MSSLPPDSYTARRLEHATAEHLHQTSLRTFIGPIPEGWLKSHRKQWYKHYLPVVGKSGSRSASFTATTQPQVDGQDEGQEERILEPRPEPDEPVIAGQDPARLSSQSADDGVNDHDGRRTRQHRVAADAAGVD